MMTTDDQDLSGAEVPSVAKLFSGREEYITKQLNYGIGAFFCDYGSKEE